MGFVFGEIMVGTLFIAFGESCKWYMLTIRWGRWQSSHIPTDMWSQSDHSFLCDLSVTTYKWHYVSIRDDFHRPL